MNAEPRDLRTRALQQFALDVIGSVSRRLAGAGIPFVATKGIVTARQLYASPSERPLSDIDLLVAEDDLDRVCATLSDAEFDRRERFRSYRVAVFNHRGIGIDIKGVVGPTGLCALPARAVIEASVDGASLGLPCRVPSLEHHALLLLINAYKDRLACVDAPATEDLRRLLDLEALPIDRFVAQCDAGHVRAIAWITVRWLRRTGPLARGREIEAALAPPPRASFSRWVDALVASGAQGARWSVVPLRAAGDRWPDVAKSLRWAAVWGVESAIHERRMRVVRSRMTRRLGASEPHETRRPGREGVRW
jgi:hypothetical protein